MEDWQKEALDEIAREQASNNILLKAGVKFSEFVSTSNGRNRRKRRQREVMLVTFRGKTYQIGNKLTKEIEFLMQDIYPENNVTDKNTDWLTSFIHELRQAQELSKYNTR